MLHALVQNLRFALRALRRVPTLTLSAILTLALCIGGTAAVFGAVYAVLFRPLPWSHPEGVLVVRELWRGQVGAMSVGNWTDLRRRDRLFEHLVPTYPQQLNLAGLDQPENVPAARVGADFFRLLGVAPAIGRELERDFPKENQERTFGASALMEELVQDYRPRLFVLLGAVGFVLLIACANIANLLLARGAARARETAIRAAIGAGRRHLAAHALAESMVLATAGGLLGLLLAYWGVGLLAAYGPEDVPRLAQARVDGPVL